MAQRKPPGGHLLRTVRLRKKADDYPFGWKLFPFRPDWTLTCSNVIRDYNFTMADLMAAHEKLRQIVDEQTARFAREMERQIIHGPQDPKYADYAGILTSFERRWLGEPAADIPIRVVPRHDFGLMSMPVLPAKLTSNGVCE